MAEYAPDEPTRIAKPPGRRLSCDSLGRSSMILGNPTETTMGGDEKRSGDDRRASKERRSGTDTRSEEEKQLTGERRSGADRRSRQDRRAESPDIPRTRSNDRLCRRRTKNIPDKKIVTSPLADAAVEGLKAKGKRDARLCGVADRSGRPIFLGQRLQQRQNAGWA
jgi:hypothetical protein